jgi:hypothetical protein
MLVGNLHIIFGSMSFKSFTRFVNGLFDFLWLTCCFLNICFIFTPYLIFDLPIFSSMSQVGDVAARGVDLGMHVSTRD